MDALEVINSWAVKGSKLRSRKALASGHLWRWIWQMNHSREKQVGNSLCEKTAPLPDSVSLRLGWCLLQFVSEVNGIELRAALGTRGGHWEEA